MGCNNMPLTRIGLRERPVPPGRGRDRQVRGGVQVVPDRGDARARGRGVGAGVDRCRRGDAGAAEVDESETHSVPI